uniref:Ribosomal protein S8 n=1 Tax=Imasa heleensis TaxID=2772037 RepID=A0A893DDJ2_9EUKA|nr:ribosomal protein S8 [Imasa heleensis]QRR29770.1 ribosomal protein S8 [Imasa heleensis]
MNYNDVISDFITRLRNGIKHSKSWVECYSNNVSINILNVLYEQGYINGYQHLSDKCLKVNLKYDLGRSVISDVSRVSKPGKRIYLNRKAIINLSNSTELYILSTSKGIMSSSKAMSLNIGGEALFSIK